MPWDSPTLTFRRSPLPVEVPGLLNLIFCQETRRGWYVGRYCNSFRIMAHCVLQMFVGSFGGDFDGFMSDVVAAVADFKDAGVTKLLIDLTNNGGGYVCLGQFLFQYLSGSTFGYPCVCPLITTIQFQNSYISIIVGLFLLLVVTSWLRRSLPLISNLDSTRTTHFIRLITVSVLVTESRCSYCLL